MKGRFLLKTSTELVNKIVRKIGIVAIALASFVAVFGVPVFAQTGNQPGSTPQVNIDSVSDIKAIMDKIIGWAFVFFFALAGVFILWAAFDYLTAGGDSKKVDSAKSKLIYAAIGIAVALIARSVAGLVEAFIR
jgi:hypothetical protein